MIRQRQNPEEVYEWLRKEAGARQITATVHSSSAKEEGGWLYVPVYVPGDLDAYDKASLLQELEDAWNHQEPEPDWQLLLIPAAK